MESESTGKAAGTSPTQDQVQVSLPDPALATRPGKHTVCGTCSLWSRDTAWDILMLKQLLVIYVVL